MFPLQFWEHGKTTGQLVISMVFVVQANKVLPADWLPINLIKVYALLVNYLHIRRLYYAFEISMQSEFKYFLIYKPTQSCLGMSKGVWPAVSDRFNQMWRVWYEEDWTIFFIAVGIHCLVHRTFNTIQPHHVVELAIGGTTITGKGNHFETASFQPSHAAPH